MKTKLFFSFIIFCSFNCFAFDQKNDRANANLRILSPLGGYSGAPIRYFKELPQDLVVNVQLAKVWDDLIDVNFYDFERKNKILDQLGLAQRLLIAVAFCSSNTSDVGTTIAKCKGNSASNLYSIMNEILIHDIGNEEFSVLGSAFNSHSFAGAYTLHSQTEVTKSNTKLLRFGDSSFFEEELGIREISCFKGNSCFIYH